MTRTLSLPKATDSELRPESASKCNLSLEEHGISQQDEIKTDAMKSSATAPPVTLFTNLCLPVTVGRFIITVRNVVAARQCFYTCLSVILFTKGGCLADTPCRHPPGYLRQTPPGQTPILGRHMPHWADTLGRHPPATVSVLQANVKLMQKRACWT